MFRRTKSTRDIQRKIIDDEQETQRNPFSVTLPRRAATTKKSGRTCGEPTESSSHRIGIKRSKSISALKDTMSMAYSGNSWNAQAPANGHSYPDRKRRTSMFFGLSNPKLPPSRTPMPPTSNQYHPSPKLPPPPPPQKLSPFPPRHSSKYGQPPPVPNSRTGLMLPETCIGVALGSPTERPKFSARISTAFKSAENLLTHYGQRSPSFTLPPEPFGVPLRPTTAGSRKEKSTHGWGNPDLQRGLMEGQFARENTGLLYGRGNADSQPVRGYPESHYRRVNTESQYGRPHVEEPPKTAGWKRMFGMGFFSRKNQAPESPRPYSPPYATLRANLTPTPCLDVDIPSVTLERYSVMFGNLLPPGQNSSLYARRRSRELLGEFNIGNIVENDKPQDTMASLLGQPQSKSQPQPQPRNRVNSLKRNATTGSVLPLSPGCENISTRPASCNSNSRSSSPVLGRSSMTPEDIYSAYNSNPLPRQTYNNDTYSPPPLSYHSPDENFTFYDDSFVRSSTASSIDTPVGSFDDGDDRFLTRNSCDEEPPWEMITPSAKSIPNKEDQIMTAAQISIARQISLSRRQLLLPVVPKSQMLVSRKSIKDLTNAAPVNDWRTTHVTASP